MAHADDTGHQTPNTRFAIWENGCSVFVKRKNQALLAMYSLFGATFAYFAHKAGKRSLVIDKRPQLGGNVYCSPFPVPSPEGQGEKVIHVHQYGAHIFHTNNKEVWDFVNSLVEFNRYTNCPIANCKGELYNLPFNMNTFCQMWKDVLKILLKNSK